MSTTPTATTVAPPERRTSTMKSFRIFDDVYPDALAFAQEDGGLSHVVNSLLTAYIEDKRAAAKPRRRRAPKVKAGADPFA